jgi:uncharacterized protein
MKSYKRLFIFLLLTLGLTCLLSPWLALAWEQILDARPEWQEHRQPFSRIFNRIFMISGIIMFFVCRRLLKIGSMAELGLPRRRRGSRDTAIGFFLALASMVALAAVMSAADVFNPYFRLSLSESLERCVKGMLTGVTVGFLEELFFRGILFKGLLEDWKPFAAFFLASFFYSAIHFVKPGKKYFLTEPDAWAGVRHLLSTFDPFFDPMMLLPGLFGLFLIGLVLSYAFFRTGNLYLAIGLHAGWIFSIKTIRVFGDYSRRDLGWLFGSMNPKIVSGVATWVGIAIVGLAVYWITRKRPSPFADRRPAKVG